MQGCNKGLHGILISWYYHTIDTATITVIVFAPVSGFIDAVIISEHRACTIQCLVHARVTDGVVSVKFSIRVNPRQYIYPARLESRRQQESGEVDCRLPCLYNMTRQFNQKVKIV